MRGAYLGSDTLKQRYFCPLVSLDLCQPPTKTGIVLSPSSMRPCRTDDLPSRPMGSVVAGASLYLHWAGNGHTAVNGTCVKVAIAPYAIDPDIQDFTIIADCLPFSHGRDLTDANITVPAWLQPGDYTLFWLWDFSPFWFSSCADIIVGRPSTTANLQDPLYRQKGCGGVLGDDYCRHTFGAASYCKLWAKDDCGKSTCHLDTRTSCLTQQQTNPTIDVPTTGIPVVSTTVAPSTTQLAISTGGGLLLYRLKGCASLASDFCLGSFGAESYCKTWQRDTCGRSTCHGPLSLPKLNSC